jgi:hypothetical protein
VPRLSIPFRIDVTLKNFLSCITAALLLITPGLAVAFDDTLPPRRRRRIRR